MHIVRGVLSLLILGLNTLACCVPLYLLGLLRPLLPGRARQHVGHWMDRIIDLWVGINRLLFRALDLTRMDVEWQGEAVLQRDRWYLVISNHQSWADILVLQNCLWGRVPPLKFFTKRQLAWIPLLGPAMWLLGFPYVRRASPEEVARNPQVRELDRRTTLESCQSFRHHPTSVLSFLEGTRFTAEKHAAQDAMYEHLLNPKLGGVSYVIASLKDRLHRVLDVTVVYPDGVPTFWALVQGRCRRVQVLVQCLELPGELREAADSDAVRARLRPWIDALWHDKDRRLASATGREVAAAN